MNCLALHLIFWLESLAALTVGQLGISYVTSRISAYSNLLKMALILPLFYVVILFFYLPHKLGLCDCTGRNLCIMVWACFASFFSLCEYGCTFMWIKLHTLQKIKRDVIDIQQDFDRSDEDDDSLSYHSHARRPSKYHRSSSRKWRSYRRNHLRNSSRPRSRRIRVGLVGIPLFITWEKNLSCMGVIFMISGLIEHQSLCTRPRFIRKEGGDETKYSFLFSFFLFF